MKTFLSSWHTARTSSDEAASLRQKIKKHRLLIDCLAIGAMITLLLSLVIAIACS